MTIYDRPAPAWRVPSPTAALAMVVAAGFGLMLLPLPVVTTLRGAAYASVRPGLVVLAEARQQVSRAMALAGNLGSSAGRSAGLQQELADARRRNAELEAQIVWLSAQQKTSADLQDWPIQPTARLLEPRLVQARVLGRQAQHLLVQRGLLDVGLGDDLSGGEWVLESPPALVDQGYAARLSAGQLVLAGGRVWGKIDKVHQRYSTVCRTTDADFRDLVRVAEATSEGQLKLVARGVLEGTGEPLCRVRHVSVTAPIAVGQWIVSDGHEGLFQGRFLYGTIERLEQAPGAAHWDIWVRPASSEEFPPEVTVAAVGISSTAAEAD